MLRPVFLRGEASFTVGDDEYLIALDAMGWIHAEQIAGKSLISLLGGIHEALEAKQEPLVGELAAILLGGLQQHHAALTYEDAINLLMADYPIVSAALNDAIVASLPASSGDEGNAVAPSGAGQKPSGAGKISSRHGAGRGKGSTTSGGKRRG